ncbi:MAG: DEAD/DEAH box helicase [Erysipelotrichaceae bacterium]|nr:DEAD/DEAH box helicase [Erysipelotrichaceae bacterium]
MSNDIIWKDSIQSLIEKKRFKEFTPIQEKCFPVILSGKDVIGISATGTGKSHAFILPILQMIDESKNQVQAIITAPTRELANQLYKQVNEITEFDPEIRVKLISSGRDRARMVDSLGKQPHIVIGTVGRLTDLFVEEAVLRLDTAKILVIDEADMTLEMGFIDEVDQLCSRLPRKLQILVFSATIPAQLQPFLRKYMNRPVQIEATEKHDSNPHISHVLVNCRHMSYQEKLLKILPGINPYVCLIFARTKDDVKATSTLLKENGYEVVEIHGDLTSRQRKQALKTINSDQATYIVCSDIMARGLDIASVSHVISLGLPGSLDFYIHRAGRTGRAGRDGISYVLYNASDIPQLKILRNKGIEFEYKDFRRGNWVEARAFDFKPQKEKIEFDAEV